MVHLPSKIIKLKTDINTILRRLESRPETYNRNYLSLLDSAMCNPDYTIQEADKLHLLIDNIFEIER